MQAIRGQLAESVAAMRGAFRNPGLRRVELAYLGAALALYANVVAVGARQHSVDEAVELVDAFLAEPFSGDARHQRRIDQLAAYERSRGTSA